MPTCYFQFQKAMRTGGERQGIRIIPGHLRVTGEVKETPRGEIWNEPA